METPKQIRENPLLLAEWKMIGGDEPEWMQRFTVAILFMPSVVGTALAIWGAL